MFCYPGISAITHHRIAHELHLLGVPLLARMLAEIAHSTTGIDIHPGARIGQSFFIDHGSTIGGNVWLTESVAPQSHIRQAQSRRNMFGDGGGI